MKGLKKRLNRLKSSNVSVSPGPRRDPIEAAARKGLDDSLNLGGK